MSTPSFPDPQAPPPPGQPYPGPAYQAQPLPGQPLPGQPAAPPGYPLPEWAQEALAEPPRDPMWTGRELGVAGLVAAALAVLGLGLGLLWSAVAPGVPALRTPDGAVLAQPEQEQMIAGEGWYLIITVLAGIVVAVLAWLLLRRYRGVAVLLALVLGSVAAGIIAFKLGHNIGHAHAKDLAEHAPVGTAFTIPPNLRAQEIGMWHGWLPYAKGDVLAMAVAALVTYILLAGFSPYPSLRPSPAEPEQTGQVDQPAPPVSSGW